MSSVYLRDRGVHENGEALPLTLGPQSTSEVSGQSEPTLMTLKCYPVLHAALSFLHFPESSGT